MTEKWRRAQDSNLQGPRGPVDFKSTALPVEASPPSELVSHGRQASTLPSAPESSAWPDNVLPCHLRATCARLGRGEWVRDMIVNQKRFADVVVLSVAGRVDHA